MILDFSKYNSLQVVGDLHDISNVENFIKNNITNISDTVFVCTGDINLGIEDYDIEVDKLANLEYRLSKNNNYFCIIRGNHDNPKYFKKNSSFRNDLELDAPHIILIPDNTIIKLQKHTILCIGGARSIDKIARIKNFNYWQNECVQRPADDFYQSLEKENIKVDIVISHTAPLFAKPYEFTNENKYYNSYLLNSWAMYDKSVKNDIYKERLLLKGIYEKLNIKNHIEQWIYGHYHISNEDKYGKTKMISLGAKEIKTIQ